MVIAGLERVPGNLEASVSPALVLKRDRASTIALCLVITVAAGLLIGIATFVASTTALLPDISPTSDAAIFGSVIGLTVAFAFGFALSGYGSAWPQWTFARQVLVVRRKTPQRLMTFLEDCHERGVLRQVGPVYEFRHIELQHRLASRITSRSSPTRLQQVALTARWPQRQPGATLRPFVPVDDRRALRRRHALKITSAVVALAVVTATLTLLDRAEITRTGAVSQKSSSLIPIEACPAKYGVPEDIPAVRSPATKSASVPPDEGRLLAYYTDAGRFIPMILGPRGWACSAGVGADGGWSIEIYPKGASDNSPMKIQANSPTCITCIYDDVCKLIPHAEAELAVPDGCSLSRTPGQIVSWVIGSPDSSASGNDVVSIVDPPHVKGYVANSGGRYYARGILLYFWGLPVVYFGYPSRSGAFGASTISCTLPNTETLLCNAILTAFSQQR